jgi:hypothetical protein
VALVQSLKSIGILEGNPMRAMTLALPVSTLGVLAICLTLQSDTAQARSRGFGIGGISIGGGIAGALLGNINRGGGGRSSSRQSGRSSRYNSSEKPSKAAAISGLALVTASSSETVFKGIQVSKGLGAVGVEEVIDAG